MPYMEVDMELSSQLRLIQQQNYSLNKVSVSSLGLMGTIFQPSAIPKKMPKVCNQDVSSMIPQISRFSHFSVVLLLVVVVVVPVLLLLVVVVAAAVAAAGVVVVVVAGVGVVVVGLYFPRTPPCMPCS